MASDSHTPPDARARESDITVRREWPTIGAYWAEVIERPAALRTENERLREENGNLSGVVDDNYALLAESRAEVKRLRDALTRIAEQDATLTADWLHWSEIAREALEAGER